MAEAVAAASRVVCPRCGGENELAAGERFFACAFCDVTLFVDRADVVGHYRLPRLVDRAGAEAALRRWMAGNQTVKDLDRKSRLEALEPLTFPLWLFRAGKTGDRVLVEPAAPTPIPEIADLEIPAGKLEPYRGGPSGAGEVIQPSVPLATARRWLDERGIETVSESALVDVPLWRARYRFRERSYDALVEASTGRVLAAIFPEKAESPFYLVAALGLVLFVVEGLLISNLLVKLFAYAVTAVPLALLAYWVTRRV